MNNDSDRLYELLPTIYRQRDEEQGWPFRALLRVISEQVEVVEKDIAQLYENWFIETSQDWVVPYIGDVVGYQIVHEAGEPGSITTAEGQTRNKILVPRRDVANTIQHRRRKGTLSLLEQLAIDVAGWPAHAVEFYRLLGRTQHLNHLQPGRGRTADLRNVEALDRLGGPFDELAHTVDVHPIVAHRTSGGYNLPNVGLFVWRLQVYSVTKTLAYLAVRPHVFMFDILGNDIQLYTNPAGKSDGRKSKNVVCFPTPIGRTSFEKYTGEYYGEDKSLFIWTRQDENGHAKWEPVELSRIVATDLTDWHYRPIANKVAVDPVLGRIAFAPGQVPLGGVRVSYHFAFSADIGGGEYSRFLPQPTKHLLFRVGKEEGNIKTLSDALRLWEKWKDAHKGQAHKAIIEITDNGYYIESRLSIKLEEKEHLHICAANNTRPVIHLQDREPDLESALDLEGSSLTGVSGSRLTFDGLLIIGSGVRISGEFAEVAFRHCTLVPGWEKGSSRWSSEKVEPSLELYNTDAQITIEHSILGSIQVYEDEVQYEPVNIKVSDSILDATSNEQEALSDRSGHAAFANLTIVRSTVFGQIKVHAIELAENTIFNGKVEIDRYQIGCMRFCYVPESKHLPRRYNCQPDLVMKYVDQEGNKAKKTPEEIDAEKQRESRRVQPVFNSTLYGTPDYCQLASTCAQEIMRGADDESEMGVFHDLFQPQRAANLRARLDEYTPADMQAGIIFAS